MGCGDPGRRGLPLRLGADNCPLPKFASKSPQSPKGDTRLAPSVSSGFMHRFKFKAKPREGRYIWNYQPGIRAALPGFTGYYNHPFPVGSRRRLILSRPAGLPRIPHLAFVIRNLPESLSWRRALGNMLIPSFPQRCRDCRFSQRKEIHHC